jgi:hypothetical protein
VVHDCQFSLVEAVVGLALHLKATLVLYVKVGEEAAVRGYLRE